MKQNQRHILQTPKASVLFLFFCAAAVFPHDGRAQDADLFFQIKKQLTIFNDVYREIATQYVEETSPEALMQGSIDAMLSGLDPYSVFIDEGEQQEMEILTSGSYGGIGIDAGFRNDQIVVIAPLEGYPAHRAGIQPGDIIEEVNEVSVHGLSPEDVQRLTIGDAGTKVRLRVKRPGIDQSIRFELERERITLKNITYSDSLGIENNNNIGYIQLARFGQQTGEEIRSVLLEWKTRGNLRGIILDMRNNPGGLLNEAVEVIDKFVAPGITVVETRGRFENQGSAFVTEEPALFDELPLVLLINNGSASASEVVAGALQDLDRAVIIGENSFGKGLVQTILPLSYNTSLKLTVSKYYTPSGRSIQSVDYGSENRDPGYIDTNSLRRSFKTRNGRIVYDGHGIEPDIVADAGDASLPEMALLRNNSFFFFVSDVLADEEEEHGSELPEKIFGRFTEYLINSGFDFETPADVHLEGLISNMEHFPETSSARESLNELKMLLQEHKMKLLNEKKEFIEHQLELEWIRQTRGEEAKHRAGLESDKQVLRALELLADEEGYLSILQP